MYNLNYPEGSGGAGILVKTNKKDQKAAFKNTHSAGLRFKSLCRAAV
jgi:hypothetical protein